jgi:parallel beta-helix repeat protein
LLYNCSYFFFYCYPSGGNYWSDYTGEDNYWGENQDMLGSDGIGDTPYDIPGDNNQDRYPLKEPWPPRVPEVIVRGKDTTYNINLNGDLPWVWYERGDRPPIMVARRIGGGAVIAAGTAATCRDGYWNDNNNPAPHLDVLLDEIFQWLVPDASNVLWYEGYNVYNTLSLCQELENALEGKGYTITDNDTEPITPGLLSGHDIVVIPQMQLGDAGTGGDPSLLPDSDVQAIADFVENGGGLLIMEQSDYAGHNYTKVQNKILGGIDAGVYFQDDQIQDDTNKWGYGAYMPIADVDTMTWIGGAYEDVTGENEIGLYSVCSLRIERENEVSVMVSPRTNLGEAGENLTYEAWIMNVGSRSDNYTVTAVDNLAWGILISENIIGLAPSENAVTEIIVTVPENLSEKVADWITLKVSGASGAEDNACFRAINCLPLEEPPYPIARPEEPHFWYSLCTQRVELPAVPIMSGIETGHSVDLTLREPWPMLYCKGEYPPVATSALVGDGRVITAGIAALRSSPVDHYTNPSLSIREFAPFWPQWLIDWSDPREHKFLYYCTDTPDTFHDPLRVATWLDDMEELGFEVDNQVGGEITPGLLENYSVLHIAELKRSLSDNEKQAIVGWVEGGGGLLLMCEADYGGYSAPKYSNEVLEALGCSIRFQDDELYDEDSWAVDGPWFPEVYLLDPREVNSEFDVWFPAALIPHDPIYIEGNNNFTESNGVVGGSGAENDPYIIENWIISAENAYGIKIRNTTSYFVARNCAVENGSGPYHWGIFLDNVVNGRIENNICENNDYGIYLNSSSNNVLSNNSFQNNDLGIYLFYSGNNNLSNNTFENCGIVIYGGVSDCNSHLIENNWVNGKPVYYYKDNTGVTVPTDAGEVILANCSSAIVRNMDISNTSVGVELAHTENSVIENSNLSSSTMGIFVYGSGNNTVKNNTCMNNDYGIALEYSSNNTLSNNTCGNNDGPGIYLGYSDNNTLGNNNCESGYWGICLQLSDNNVIFDSSVENNNYGISISFNSGNNTLANNTCENNGCGIYLKYSSDNNQIYHNNLMNNENQAHDNGSNYWDNGYPSGGNYWSDYAGVDENHGENQDSPGSDGIGDTPYDIPGGSNQDRYPLMNPWPCVTWAAWKQTNWVGGPTYPTLESDKWPDSYNRYYRGENENATTPGEIRLENLTGLADKWTQTTKDDFELGSLENLDTSTAPGFVILRGDNTTFGNTNNNESERPYADYTYIQRVDPGGQYAAPYNGVIIRWRWNPGDLTTNGARFKIFRHVSGTTWTLVGESDPVDLTGGLNVFNLDFSDYIPVKAGDRIGMYSGDDRTRYSDTSGYYVSRTEGDISGTSSFTEHTNPRRLPIDATLRYYRYSGTLTSCVHDTGGFDTNWRKISWDETLPPGTDITFKIRTGDTEVPDNENWSDWSYDNYTNPAGEIIMEPSGRYIQYKATFSTTDTAHTPILHKVKITYITSAQYKPSGYIESSVYDAGTSVDWRNITWEVETPSILSENKPVNAEPDPIVDCSPLIGENLSFLENAQAHDNIYENIAEELRRPWWNRSWALRRPVTVSNENNPSTLENYQVKIVVDNADNMNENFNDLRFVDNDDATELSYWIENYNPSENAAVWVKVLDIPANDNKTIYMYYGNPCASPASDFSTTFPNALIIDGTSTTLGGIQEFDWVEIRNGGTLNVESENMLELFARKIIVDSASSIDAIGRGYLGGPTNRQRGQQNNGTSYDGTPGTGGGTGGYALGSSHGPGGGGGGYAGSGGDGGGARGENDYPGAGGSTFGNASDNSIYMGSGGGSGGLSRSAPQNDPWNAGGAGGAGGGSIRLNASIINISGTVSADGGDGAGGMGTSSHGNGGGGGGSGGTILIEGNKLIITGTLSAKGGTGGARSPNTSRGGAGGGGGGGRIKVFYDEILDNAGATYSVDGGDSGGPSYESPVAQPGTPGTTHTNNISYLEPITSVRSEELESEAGGEQEYCLNWEHRITGVKQGYMSYTLHIWGYSDNDDENIGAYIWESRTDSWSFMGNLPKDAPGDPITFNIGRKKLNNYLVENSLLIGYFDNTGDETRTIIHIDHCVLQYTGNFFTELEVYTRTGNTENAYDGSWDNWQKATNGGGVPSPDARYIQYRVELRRPELCGKISPVFIEMTINYAGIVRDVHVWIENNYQSAEPCNTLEYTITVTNTGNVDDNYLLSWSDNAGWGDNIWLEDNSLWVAHGSENSTSLYVHVPENAEPCTEDKITVTATSASDNTVSGSDWCVAHVVPPTPWTGTAEFELENLYAVSLEKDLWLYTGSKLVVKFYKYDDTPQDNSVIDNWSALPHQVKENENVPHPRGAEGFPWGTVQVAKLVLTTDNTANEISEIASFTVCQSDLREEYIIILLNWASQPDKHDAWRREIMDKLLQWASAPP